MRLINADELMELYDGCDGLSVPIAVVQQNIKDATTIDAEPVRHGQWKCNKPCPVCGGDRFEGLDADIWADWEPPYCPNCGAKMDGGTE